jgi:hypothetical protein
MCTSNQERICFLIEGRASLPLRGIISEARHTFLPSCQLFFKKSAGKCGGIKKMEPLKASKYAAQRFRESINLKKGEW